MKKFAGFLVTTIILLMILSACQQFGKLPDTAANSKIEQSANYSRDQQRFINGFVVPSRSSPSQLSFWDDPFGKQQPNFLFNRNQTTPNSYLPHVSYADLRAEAAASNGLQFVWLGHSTLLLFIGTTTVLIDPVFSTAAAPLPIIVRRFQPPAIALAELPPIDYVVISHDHYDHLDMATIKHFASTNVQFLVPLGVGSHLLHWGVAANKIRELDWWDSFTAQDLQFTATPAQHFSGRLGPFLTNKTLWSSWVIRHREQSLFFSGDSGFSEHYKEIGGRLGPFDLVFMDSGQYNEQWRSVHNMPSEVIQGFKDLQGRYLIPIHWGMFSLSLHNWFDPPEQVSQLARAEGIAVLTPRLGELVSVNRPPPFQPWWRDIITDAAP